MEQSAVEWLTEKLRVEFGFVFSSNILEQAKEMEKQQQGYSEEEVFKTINDFYFDWNYNYKGELSQKNYLVEWFEKLKK